MQLQIQNLIFEPGSVVGVSGGGGIAEDYRITEESEIRALEDGEFRIVE